MIYDCFIFYNEIDILKMRLEELYPVVDRFVIVEMDRTFQGEQKGSFFKWHKKEFTPWLDKIHAELVHCPDFINDPWHREYFQRNWIHKIVDSIGANADDILIVGDADEIPRRSAVAAMDPQPVQSFALDAYYYGLNVSGGHRHTNRAARWEYARTMKPQELRTLDPPPNVVYDAGWHFSYLGDAEHIANKFKAFAHSELNRPDTTDTAILQARMEAHGDLWGDGHVYEVVEIDDTWPEAVKRDRAYWSKYEW